uniref:RNA-directed DNA polymerase, eukaryota, reverse transcriptase zinc-binding domain protein n=1 Tax=Tanacetum cinerariifolium TaxID=118510 RepID=A0A699JZ30_TANCI|nr:RNA-directed DNA polymerase, eukaryota, reverse transcriptase zinc-binding domain protein [Tanacetum cinerariifolium]
MSTKKLILEIMKPEFLKRATEHRKSQSIRKGLHILFVWELLFLSLYGELELGFAKNSNKQKNGTKNKKSNNNNGNGTVEYVEDDVTVVNGQSNDVNLEGGVDVDFEENEGNVNGNVDLCSNDCGVAENDSGKVNAELNSDTIDKHDDDSMNVETERQSSYASKLNANITTNGNKLFFVPTCTNNKGDEVVIFEEELVKEGCEKWKYTVCGYFAVCRMYVYELKYNIRRMYVYKLRQKEVRKFISDEKVHVCAILETHLKSKNISQSLKNPSNNTLKKLDRIMCNDKFLSSYGHAHGMFLPFLISDHSPAIVIVPNGLPRKKKSFRFVNYVGDKSEFLDIVKKGWDMEIDGCNMFKVVKRMRYLKKALNDLNWKNGNLFDNVVILKQ